MSWKRIFMVALSSSRTFTAHQDTETGNVLLDGGVVELAPAQAAEFAAALSAAVFPFQKTSRA